MPSATFTTQRVVSLARHVRRSSLHRNSVWLMLSIVIASCLGYAYWVAAARLFPSAQVGLATGLVSLMTVTATVANFGVATALVQRLPVRDNIDDWSTTLSGSVIGGAVLGVSSGAVVLVLVPVLSHRLAVVQRDPVLALLFIVGTACCIVSMVLDFAFIAERNSRSTAIRGGIFGLIKIPLLIVPVFVLSGGRSTTVIFASWVLAYAASCVIALTVMMPKLRPGFSIRRRGAFAELRTNVRLLTGNYFTTLGTTLPLYILPVIVVTRLSATANAYFYITWMVGGAFFMISSAIGSALYAEGSNDPAKIGSIARSSVRFTALLLTPAMLIVFATGKWILEIFGSAYSQNGTHLLWVLTLASIPDAITNLYVAVLRVRGRLRAAGCLTMGMAIFTMVAAWIVAPSLKLVGIGVIWLLGQVLGSIWVAWDMGALARILRWATARRKPHHDAPFVTTPLAYDHHDADTRETASVL